MLCLRKEELVYVSSLFLNRLDIDDVKNGKKYMVYDEVFIILFFKEKYYRK